MIRFLTFLTVMVWLILGAGTVIYGLAVETGMLQSIRDMIAAVGCVVMAGFALRFGEWLHDRTVEFELQRTAALWQRNLKKPRPVVPAEWMSPYRSEDDTEPIFAESGRLDMTHDPKIAATFRNIMWPRPK